MPIENFKDLHYLHITKHRWVFWRFLEGYLGKHLPGIWRIEWKPRQTGALTGKPMPHLHILIMQHDYIPWQECRWLWQKTIGERFVNIDVRAVYDIEVVIGYLSKYLGKVSDDTLEDDAYLNSIPPGRCWGFMRKNLIKNEDKWTGRFFETDDLAMLRSYAIQDETVPHDADILSFTLIGRKAREVGEIAFSTDIDARVNLD